MNCVLRGDESAPTIYLPVSKDGGLTPMQKQVIIEVLKALKGIERLLQKLLKQT